MLMVKEGMGGKGRGEKDRRMREVEGERGGVRRGAKNEG